MRISRICFAIVLFSLSCQLLAATEYGLNETDWRVADNKPTGASIGFVDEPLLGKAVATTDGAARSNSYLLGDTNASSGWNNQSEYLFSWRQLASENVTLYVRVDTTLGWRWLYYNHSSSNNLLNASGRQIHHGLGASAIDGQWHTWARDLALDLNDAEPGNELLAVNGVLVRGNVQVDGITLSAQNQSPQAVIDVNSTTIALGDELILDSQNSVDPDGALYEYIWRNAAGDILGTDTQWQGEVSDAGQQRFSLEVTDNEGLSAITSTVVEVIDVSIPTIYSDAEDGSDDGWRLSDKTPDGSALNNVVDPTASTNLAIQTTSSGVKNSFILGYTNPAKGWNNTLQTNVSWRSRADANFRVYVRVTTPDGWRYLWYDSQSVDKLANNSGNAIHHGLGAESIDGEWHSFSRDLQADLEEAQPGNTIIAVHAMLVRGSIMIDDVALVGLTQESPPPTPETPTNISPVVDAGIEAGSTQSFIWQNQDFVSVYEFHLFDRTNGDLSSVYDIDPAVACDESVCSIEYDISLPVHASHAWRVRAKNESGISAWSRSEFDVLELLTAVPDAPVISLPLDNSVVEPSGVILLQWQTYLLATGYDFGLFDPYTDTTTYSSAIEPLQICTTTTCTLSQANDLPIGEGYQLRIRTHNRLGSSDWSERTFSVAEPVIEPTTAPITPINISPEVSVQLFEGHTVEFSWAETELTASYDFHFFDNESKDLQYTNDLLPSDICVEGVCRLSTEVNLPVFDRHAWRVRASNAAGNSSWSRSLFEVIAVPDLTPAMPVNVSPAVDAILIASSAQQFSWEPVTDAITYDFYLFDLIEGDLPSVLNLNASDICSALSCEYQTDIMSTVAVGHAWRVRAVNQEGISAWSRSVFSVRNEADETPVADFTASDVFGTAPLSVSVNASSSYDPDAISEYRWDFAGQNSIEGADTVTTSHEFVLPGTYTITLTVLNAAGFSDSKAIDVTVTEGIPADAPSETEAARLLAQASFGASSIAIQQVRQVGLEEWVDAQLELQGPAHLDYVTTYSNGSNRDARHEMWWLDAIDGEDQLRQRVAFALSQLMAISDTGFTLANAQYGVTNYYDILRNYAFGNFRELLEEVTLSPVMGIYLSMLQNDKGSELANTRADENFAREVLQLFSIGLYNLNQDGTRATGNTFTQDNIESFARVFTGWNYKDAGRWDRVLFTGQDLINPMVAFEDHHDDGDKTLLNGFQVPAGQSAQADLEMALDNIFAHQNVGPFISSHLIRQLITSNPTPAYVSRVAGVFNDNGSGVKGDLGATVKAILMDEEARNPTNLDSFGKLREPVFRLSHLWRAFAIAPGNLSARGEYNTYSTSLKNIETITGQAVLRSPSVFNFFSPTYAPLGPVQSAQLVSPVFEIFTDSNILSTASRINSQIHRHYKQNPTATELNPSYLDFAYEIALAEEPQALLDHLNVVLLSGSMSEELNSVLFDHLNSLPTSESGYQLRVQDAVSLIAASPEYLVQR